MDFAAAGLLDGLEGDERAAREQLLESLVEEGFSLEELQAAVAEDRLALLPVLRVLGGQYTAIEVAERTGLPVELLVRMRRLLGLPECGPEERVFSDEEAAAAQSSGSSRVMALQSQSRSSQWPPRSMRQGSMNSGRDI